MRGQPGSPSAGRFAPAAGRDGFFVSRLNASGSGSCEPCLRRRGSHIAHRNEAGSLCTSSTFAAPPFRGRQRWHTEWLQSSPPHLNAVRPSWPPHHWQNHGSSSSPSPTVHAFGSEAPAVAVDDADDDEAAASDVPMLDEYYGALDGALYAADAAAVRLNPRFYLIWK